MDKSLRTTFLQLPLSSKTFWTRVTVPFRSAKQTHIAMQVIQQLACSLVQSRLDAGAAQAVDRVLDGIQVGLAGCCLAGRGWASVQAQNGLLHLIQKLDIYAYSVLHTRSKRRKAARHAECLDLTLHYRRHKTGTEQQLLGGVYKCIDMQWGGDGVGAV